MSPHSADSSFQVSWSDSFLTNLIHRNKLLWIKIADIETNYLIDDLNSIQIVKPIYICGLARSGSTILLESISSHPDIGTHKYRDFPAIFTPYFWNKFLSIASKKESLPTERAHKDRILVTKDSPEAMEEPLWMAFFNHLHDSGVDNILSFTDSNKHFEQAYKDHIKKLLFIRQRNRYLSKGNYNISRIGYLLKLFPDARFVVPIRNASSHVASLMKQHKLFMASSLNNQRAIDHLNAVGHFEFGPNRIPINTGNTGDIDRIINLWRSGEEVRGWAAYWSLIYSMVSNMCNNHPDVEKATLIVRYEDLCSNPFDWFERIFQHCNLEIEQSNIDKLSTRVSSPSYYKPSFCEEDLKVISEESSEVSEKFGY